MDQAVTIEPLQSTSGFDDDTLRQALLAQIERIANEGERWHAVQHLYRYLETLKRCPPGPARVLDLGYSPIYCEVLRQLYGYTVDYIKGLRINFEADRYPYDDASLDGALCCEVIEHYTDDPMFSMIELNRIIKPDGWLLLTTPNVASWEAIYRALRMDKHPSRYPVYAAGGLGAHCIHVREYLPDEVTKLMEAAGFEVQSLHTHNYDPARHYPPIAGYPETHRGETIFCLARKRSRPLKRFVAGIYGQDVPFDRHATPATSECGSAKSR